MRRTEADADGDATADDGEQEDTPSGQEPFAVVVLTTGEQIQLSKAQL